MRKCPFHNLQLVRTLVRGNLGTPTITHQNSLRFLGGESIEDIIDKFTPPNSIKNKKHTFYIKGRLPYERERYSLPLTLSLLGYLLYIHCIQYVEGISIEASRIYTENPHSLKQISLLYYALQAFDVIFSQATLEELGNEEWLRTAKINTIQLASLPDMVQKGLTERISILDIVRENIDAVLHGSLFVFTKKSLYFLRALNGIKETQFSRNGQYGLCPAIIDGTLASIFDRLAALYRVSK